MEMGGGIMPERKGLDEFLIKCDSGLTFDMGALAELSDEDFVSRRLIEMKKYIENHKKFHGHVPKCFECSVSIGAPERLVRYFGASLHPDCFKEYYLGERDKQKENHRQYFDRVLKVLSPD